VKSAVHVRNANTIPTPGPSRQSSDVIQDAEEEEVGKYDTEEEAQKSGVEEEVKNSKAKEGIKENITEEIIIKKIADGDTVKNFAAQSTRDDILAQEIKHTEATILQKGMEESNWEEANLDSNIEFMVPNITIRTSDRLKRSREGNRERGGVNETKMAKARKKPRHFIDNGLGLPSKKRLSTIVEVSSFLAPLDDITLPKHALRSGMPPDYERQISLDSDRSYLSDLCSIASDSDDAEIEVGRYNSNRASMDGGDSSLFLERRLSMESKLDLDDEDSTLNRQYNDDQSSSSVGRIKLIEEGVASDDEDNMLHPLEKTFLYDDDDTYAPGPRSKVGEFKISARETHSTLSTAAALSVPQTPPILVSCKAAVIEAHQSAGDMNGLHCPDVTESTPGLNTIMHNEVLTPTMKSGINEKDCEIVACRMAPATHQSGSMTQVPVPKMLDSLLPGMQLLTSAVTNGLLMVHNDDFVIIDHEYFHSDANTVLRINLQKRVKKVLMPLHHISPHKHWTLCCMDLVTGLVQYYDPLDDSRYFLLVKDRLLSLCRKFIDRREHGEKIEPKLELMKGPRQNNGYDCGVYVAVAGLYLLAELEIPQSVPCNLWRLVLRSALSQTPESWLSMASSTNNIITASVDILQRQWEQLQTTSGDIEKAQFIVQRFHDRNSERCGMLYQQLAVLRSQVQSLETITELLVQQKPLSISCNISVHDGIKVSLKERSHNLCIVQGQVDRASAAKTAWKAALTFLMDTRQQTAEAGGATAQRLQVAIQERDEALAAKRRQKELEAQNKQLELIRARREQLVQEQKIEAAEQKARTEKRESEFRKIDAEEALLKG